MLLRLWLGRTTWNYLTCIDCRPQRRLLLLLLGLQLLHHLHCALLHVGHARLVVRLHAAQQRAQIAFHAHSNRCLRAGWSITMHPQWKRATGKEACSTYMPAEQTRNPIK
jgi:hypothetical protein